MKHNLIVSDAKADAFLLGAVLILLLNFVNQFLAFPFQICCIAWALWKCDVKLLPGIVIVSLDKFFFRVFGDGFYIKIRIAGFGFSVMTTYMMIVFVIVAIWMIRGFYDRYTGLLYGLLLTTAVPAFVIAWQGRSAGVSFWQDPLNSFLTPALYFWGVHAARTWDAGKLYFCKRMALLYALFNTGELMRVFHVFSFVDHVLPICLALVFLRLKGVAVWRVISILGALVALANLLFGGYITQMNTTGTASAVDIGSTFTRLMVVIIGLIFALAFGKSLKRNMLRCVPWLGLIFCIVVFSYAVGRAGSMTGSMPSNDYRTWLERFEFKLVADRGVLWRQSLEKVFHGPLVFRDMRDRLKDVRDAVTGATTDGLACMAHNQILKLLIDEGWWLGLILVIFLWTTHLRAFKAASVRDHDVIDMVAVMAPYGAVFIAVGLTGQSVLQCVLYSNGIVTLAFPGIIYGAVNSMNNWRKNNAYPLA